MTVGSMLFTFKRKDSCLFQDSNPSPCITQNNPLGWVSNFHLLDPLEPSGSEPVPSILMEEKVYVGNA